MFPGQGLLPQGLLSCLLSHTWCFPEVQCPGRQPRCTGQALLRHVQAGHLEESGETTRSTRVEVHPAAPGGVLELGSRHLSPHLKGDTLPSWARQWEHKDKIRGCFLGDTGGPAGRGQDGEGVSGTC